ncbi:hypothetical protein [Micromonospora sp. NBC_01796]|uniref:hypothetical protein n=1 Tax=Micromonospora sp. NBC_01796 TaxID=2975987 RepID=UPI002DDBB6E1|nr:hypothetical protein [Micromonospora sp. NBC_01796]WSA87957.1 hypothetical protein OIE47_10300 [Micromonospora sp. NBC_01796]
MKIKPEMVDYIRTMVKGDHEANDRIEAELDAEGWDNFSTLLGAVFYYAVHRRLNAKATAGEIILFVAEMRAAAPSGSQIDPTAAEELVRAALDPSIDISLEPQMVGRTQGLAILHILSSPDVTNQELETLLGRAVDASNQA